MQSIDRTVRILDFLSSMPDGATISEISTHISLPLATTHRFLQSLLRYGLVEQDPRSKLYSAGLKIIHLAADMLNGNRLLEAAKAPMIEAANKIGNVVYLSQANSDLALCVYCVNIATDQRTRFAAQVGNLMPVHAAAAGKIIFAYRPDDELRRILASLMPLTCYTPHTNTTIEAVLNDYAKCRNQGYALCDEELEPGVIAIAAPVFNYQNEVVASVAATGIKSSADLEKMVDAIKNCAQKLSLKMGFRG